MFEENEEITTQASKNFTAEDIANYIIYQLNGEVNRMKLSKMLYYAQGWHLALFDKLLFNEAVLADQYGPNIQSICDKYAEYGMRDLGLKISSVRRFDKETTTFLNQIIKVHGAMTDIQLANDAHGTDSAWRAHVDKYGHVVNMSIDFDLIKQSFRKIMKSENSGLGRDLEVSESSTPTRGQKP